MADLTGDFQYSIAQEDVDFVTQIVQSTTPGENYQNVAIYIENSRFVADPTAFIAIGSSAFKLATLTKNNYALVTQGLLLSWLTDFFANGTSSKVYLITIGADIVDDSEWATLKPNMQAAYDLTKTMAYWKLPLIATDAAAGVLLPVAAADFVAMNNVDLGLLSAAVPLPLTTLDLATDPLYSVIPSSQDVWFCAHGDPTRHGGLFSLGMAMSAPNNTGTPVGNSIDYVKTNLIPASGPGGTALNTTVQGLLKAENIQYFKPIGNNTGQVAAVGQKTKLGNYILANWIVNYCNFVNKVRTAEIITNMNYFKNRNNYQSIVLNMTNVVQQFETMGRLSNFTLSAPPFEALPTAAGDEIVIPNAWSAYFIDNVRKVRTYGTLYIQA